ncbi:7TM-DISM domain-containing protein [Variovorax sp. LT1R16]|uniref:7TMR-DISMED2 domain-containing protein n=1 Tax=Variovorax sp. LT1R16 TaxID=3443728 RepID=UPI003F450924
MTLTPSDGLERPMLPAGAVDVLSDPSGAWDIEAVSRGPHSRDFVPLARPLVAGFTHDVVWLRLSLARASETPERWLLRILPARLQEVTLYAPDGQGGHIATALGARMPFAQREIADHHFVFPLTVGTTPAPYYRSASVAKVAGSGLGLHLSREIARRHGGEVSLVATGDGGATFRLVLPTTPPPPRSDFAAL